jgi:uncharacterized protein YrrD
MLRSMHELEGCAIVATDGAVGHVTDCYFDDQRWVLRYLVVETGSWLASRKVLISPFAIGRPDWSGRVLPVSITKQQVRNSPDIDTDQPVSRQHELQYLRHFGYPYYWLGTGLWGSAAYPGAMLTGVGYTGSGAQYLVGQAVPAAVESDASQFPEGDAHLRSGTVLLRYHIEASDGGLGQVKGLLFDEDSWAIRYLIVETSSWWHGHQVLLAPEWIRELSWPDATISVSVSRQAVKNAPVYDASAPLNRAQETSLFEHHGRAAYWAEEVKLENPQFQAPRSAPSIRPRRNA